MWFADGVRTGEIKNPDRESLSKVVANTGPTYLPFITPPKPPGNPTSTGLEAPSVSVAEREGRERECSESETLNTLHPIKPLTTSNVKRSRRAVTYSESFLTFWNAFPRRAGKGSKVKAYELWARLSETDQELASGDLLARIANHPDWHSPRDSGRFLPMVTTYLRGRNWEDGWGQEPATAAEAVPEPDWKCSGCWRTYGAAEANGLAACVACGSALRPPEAMP